MSVYQYQSVTAPVGLYDATPQQPVFWYVQGTRQAAPRRRPQRDSLVHTIISGFEATNIDKWGWVEQRRSYRIFPQRDDSVTPAQPEVGTSVSHPAIRRFGGITYGPRRDMRGVH